jgi:hypothetical protein
MPPEGSPPSLEGTVGTLGQFTRFLSSFGTPSAGSHVFSRFSGDGRKYGQKQSLPEITISINLLR